MKKTILLLTAFVFTAIASGQVPDFTGNWKLNNSKSNLNYDFTLAPGVIIIAHKDNDMTIEKHSSFQGQDYTSNDKFTLDGKECVNPGWMDSQKKSTAIWADDKKSLKITTNLSAGDIGDVTIVEILKMVEDNMVIESTATSSYGDLVETMVYDKQ